MESVKVMPELIPDYIWGGLAEGALGLLREITSTPGGREALDRKKAELWPEKYGRKGN